MDHNIMVYKNLGRSALKSTDHGPNERESSRKRIVEVTKASLRKLRLDYLDLVYCEMPEPLLHIEETVRAANYVIEAGWAFYLGMTGWPSKYIKKAFEIADRLDVTEPVVEQ
ncbi:hypothetical protein L1987_33524 [Smallanthus sonchifolius]|uniref:Uncharacterized protein n=1 Tax=Smallanthus sonchifolius TaxID=185202 RepID=A0ACB9HS43_9ASTR|nr:hypothetical protein L1987_33524 [Smallanthus sonchifolius]